MELADISSVKFDAHGLVPAIAQDVNTNAVVMLAYMNEESLRRTIESGFMTYYSRSRGELWKKGETSGNTQKVVELRLDCDGDSVLALIEQKGSACHTGEYSCFYRALCQKGGAPGGYAVIDELFSVISDRKDHPKEKSYTNYLFDKGLDKILKKVGEESAETIIAAKNRSKDEVRYEMADLAYHLLVLLKEMDMTPGDIAAELKSRR